MREIALTRGKVTIVDDADYETLTRYNWCARKKKYTWYALRTESIGDGKQTTVMMHREILGAIPGQEIDHWDGDGLHNWRENLRFCTHAENQQNLRHKRVGASSKYKGVYRREDTGKWRARLTVNRKKVHLGYFVVESDAARAYNDGALRYFGEFACLNNLGDANAYALVSSV